MNSGKMLVANAGGLNINFDQLDSNLSSNPSENKQFILHVLLY